MGDLNVMTIGELKKLINEIPESEDNTKVYVYERSGNIGYASGLKRAYVGKTYTRDRGCIKAFQLQFDASNIITESNFNYHIDKIKKSVNGEDYYLKESFPLPEFKTITEALDYLKVHIGE